MLVVALKDLSISSDVTAGSSLVNFGDVYMWIAALNIFQYGDNLQIKDIVQEMIHKVEINI